MTHYYKRKSEGSRNIVRIPILQNEMEDFPIETLEFNPFYRELLASTNASSRRGSEPSHSKRHR